MSESGVSGNNWRYVSESSALLYRLKDSATFTWTLWDLSLPTREVGTSSQCWTESRGGQKRCLWLTQQLRRSCRHFWTDGFCGSEFPSPLPQTGGLNSLRRLGRWQWAVWEFRQPPQRRTTRRQMGWWNVFTAHWRMRFGAQSGRVVHGRGRSHGCCWDWEMRQSWTRRHRRQRSSTVPRYVYLGCVSRRTVA